MRFDGSAGGVRARTDRTLPARRDTGRLGSLQATPFRLALAALVALAASCTAQGFGRTPPPASGELPGADDLAADTADATGPAPCPDPPPDGTGKTLRILFIGNSYTSANDLPGTFAALAAAGGRKVKVERQVHDGWTLGSPPGAFGQDAPTLSLLARGWDVVVLQEQSQIPSYPGMVETATIPGARALAAAVRKTTPCVRMVLFQTWGRRDGMPPDFADFDDMQDALTAGYGRVAEALEAEVAPVGESWRIVRRDHPELALHAGDGSHPAPAGTYLAACALYGRIFLQSPAGLAAPAGIPSPQVLQDASVAAQSW